MLASRHLRCIQIQKHTKGSKERLLIKQNKTGCEFSRNSSFSKLRTIVQYKNQSVSCPLPSARIQLAKDKWFICLLFVLCVTLKKDFVENLHPVLFCLIKKSVLFNLLCVFGSFFQNAGSQLLFQKKKIRRCIHADTRDACHMYPLHSISSVPHEHTVVNIEAEGEGGGGEERKEFMMKNVATCVLLSMSATEKEDLFYFSS